MATLILGAIEEELSEFRRNLCGREERRWNALSISLGVLSDKKVIVAGTGVGKTMSALATQYLIDQFAPERIFFVGIAGGLNSGLSIGDVVVATDSIQHDLDARAAGFELGQVPLSPYREIPSDPELVESAMGFEASGFRIIKGRILTGDQLISRRGDGRRDYLAGELRGDAVEMEGASVGLVALVNRIPFLLMRVISDRAMGGDRVDFKKFLPIASERTYRIICHVLSGG
ncbi:MAG TPA: 5'-methylthioadenosine/adenosylhomocysteine nucleosidase [Spirochaetia bacterium]|nr:5'-methylthioadenosine/adenosylhomocysteine nucleosidase [Spirochaetia bacterium]